MNKDVKILSLWESDFDDIRCNAMLYQNNKEVANIVASFDSNLLNSLCKYDVENIDKIFKTIIRQDFDSYISLPKLSKCSKLLKELYDNVFESDATMCHITNEDWNDFYKDRYTERDINILRSEVKKYKLEDIITFNESEYKIVCYGNLETSFNDDRKIKKEREVER